MYLAEGLPELVEAVTGIKYSIEDLFAVGARANWMRKMMNMRRELSRKDDSLPPRILVDPNPMDSRKEPEWARRISRSCWMTITGQEAGTGMAVHQMNK